MEKWFFIALLAPFFWSLVVLIDVYFARRVYEQAHEGTVISGFYQGMVLFAFPFVDFVWPDGAAAVFFFLGGIAFIFAYHSYFRTMIQCGDGALVQILWNISALLVPVLAWAIASERLAISHYVGILLAFFGGVVLSWDEKNKIKNLPLIGKNIIPGIILLSVSMVFEKQGFDASPAFFPGFLLFSTGVVFGAGVVFFAAKHPKRLGSRMIELCRKHWKFFLLAETLNVLGTFFSQWAINLTPAVSFVATIESLVPVFVMFNGILLSGVFLAMGKNMFADMYREQISGLQGKIVAILFIAGGIFLVA